MIPSIYDPFKRWAESGSIYILSDLHFDDEDCKFMDENWIKPEEQIAIINSVVLKNDTFICLGDVGKAEYVAQISARRKILLLGNHDKKKDYVDYFDEIYSGPLFISEKILLSHEPVYGLTWCLNIHGHDHSNMEDYAEGCEHLNLAANVCGYKPVNLGQLIKEGALSKISSIHRETIDRASGRKAKGVEDVSRVCDYKKLKQSLKTIQQVIQEMDSERIEKAYFYEHPVNLIEVRDFDEATIGVLKAVISERFQAFIDRLRNMEIKNDSGKQGLLFVYKSQTESTVLGTDVGLIHLDELFEETDLSKINTYAYEFTQQKESLSFLVADTKLTQDNLMDVVVSFLDEISFFGYEQEDLQEELDLLNASIKECEEHPENLKATTADDLRERFGLPKEEIYQHEMAKAQNFYKAGMDYTQYCKTVELEKIKDSLMAQ